jgi:hypothetical protein
MGFRLNAAIPFMLLGLIGCIGTAQGEDAAGDRAFQRQLFGKELGTASSAFACFTRTYDPGHLASHPRQNVRTMKLLVTGRGESEGSAYALSMDVTFRRSREHFGTSGFCGSIHEQSNASVRQPTVHCGIDCDGGNIDVSLRDAKSVLVGIPDGARISSDLDTDETADHSKRFGSDDKVFRLDRAKITDCLSLANDDDKPIMRRMR